MRKIKPQELAENAIKLIGKDWMLITAGNMSDFNMMTASWGSLGEIWGVPAAFVFIRPQRYTFEFAEREDMLTLSFFEEKYRPALQLCGTKSGRDIDKVTESALTPYATGTGNVAFEEASIVMECRKVYADDIKEGAFVDKDNISKWYPQKDFHRMYILEIVNVWVK